MSTQTTHLFITLVFHPYDLLFNLQIVNTSMSVLRAETGIFHIANQQLYALKIYKMVWVSDSNFAQLTLITRRQNTILFYSFLVTFCLFCYVLFIFCVHFCCKLYKLWPKLFIIKELSGPGGWVLFRGCSHTVILFICYKMSFFKLIVLPFPYCFIFFDSSLIKVVLNGNSCRYFVCKGKHVKMK